jgi:hypothetical protein
MKHIESLNRTVKIALDDGSANSIEEALARFAGFHIQIVVGDEARSSRALQACLQTILNAAPRTFQGELTIAGSLDFIFDGGWHKGQSLIEVAEGYGVSPSSLNLSKVTLVVGQLPALTEFASFALYVQCTSNGFALSPDPLEQSALNASELVGVAAAGAALNECFQFLYFKRPWAGQRDIEYSFPVSLFQAQLPESIRVIGLGHLGQAAIWSLGFLQGLVGCSTKLVLQDYDKVSVSSLSTGLLTNSGSVGLYKVDVVKGSLDLLGVSSCAESTRVELDKELLIAESVCLVAVDDFMFRKKLDRVRGARLVEAGIGDGVTGFTRFQVHLLPGKRMASDIWIGNSEAATRPVSISAPAYQKLLEETYDECGTTQLAGRSVATPFLGAFVGAHMVAYALSRFPIENDTLVLDVNAL